MTNMYKDIVKVFTKDEEVNGKEANWKTVKGHHIAVGKGGEIVAGGVPGTDLDKGKKVDPDFKGYKDPNPIINGHDPYNGDEEHRLIDRYTYALEERGDKSKKEQKRIEEWLDEREIWSIGDLGLDELRELWQHLDDKKKEDKEKAQAKKEARKEKVNEIKSNIKNNVTLENVMSKYQELKDIAESMDVNDPNYSKIQSALSEIESKLKK